MSGQRNWNDMSSSDEENSCSDKEDSWFDSDQENKEKKQETTPQVKVENQQESNRTVEVVAKTNQSEESNKPQQQTVEKQQQPQQQPKKQGAQKKHNFLKDEDLQVEYSNKTVDDPRIIKAVKVFNEQHKQLLKNLKNARVKEVREGIFILNFNTPEDVIEFIREKIANRYRFFLQPFFKRKEEEGKDERRERNDDRRRDKDRRPRYQDEKEGQERRQRKEQREQREPREPRRGDKQEDKGKKVYLPKDCFEIESNKNVVIIRSEGFDIDKVIDELDQKKVFKNFNKLRIKTPFAFMGKVSKLITQIGSKYKFNLEKEPPADTKKQEMVEVTLIQNFATKAASKPAAENYQEEKQSKPVKQARQQAPPPPTKNEPVEVNARKLANNYDDYFANISKYNLSQIVKGFDQNQYVKRLKENSATIEKNWNSWKIEAEDQNIEALLKLTHRLKKSTLYDADLKPSMRNLKPILTAELKPRPEKDRRPKVDVSGVNGYLS